MLVVALSACGGETAGPVRLVWPGNGAYWDTLPAPVGQSMVLQELKVCADAPTAQDVQIVDVRPAQIRNGFVTTGWGYLPSWRPGQPERASIFPSTLSSAHYSRGPVVLHGRCKESSGSHDDNQFIPLTFALEAHRSTSANAYALGVVVEYTSNGQHGQATIPVVLGICAENSHPACGDEAEANAKALTKP